MAAKKTSKKSTSKIPFGVVSNLPVWQCNGCDDWQSGINANGERVRPRACPDCGPGQTYRATIGWCNGHKPVVVALAAKGWRFPSETVAWAAAQLSA